MNAREIAGIAILLVAGTVLQYGISPLGLLLTPDVITAFFCLGIILFRPKFSEALVIGIAGGFLSMLIPGSILPWANLISGPAGAYACYYVYETYSNGSAMAPLFTTCTATLVSGCAFVAVATVFVFDTIISRFGDFSNFIGVYLPIIIGTALVNAVIVQALFFLIGRAAGKQPA